MVTRAIQYLILCSRLVILAFDRLGLTKSSPRKASTLGLFSRYDGNIVGGALVGIGMTLTGACPGTSLVQIMTGVHSGLLVIVGGVLGGISYVKFSNYFRCSTPSSSVNEDNHTIYEKLNVNRNLAVLAYEFVCLVVIATALILNPHRPTLLHSTLGGVLIGGAQTASLLLTGNPVGVSTAYEDIGNAFWRYVRSGSRPNKTEEKPISLKSIVFATGILMGSWALSLLIPSLRVKSDFHISRAAALLGGFAMVFGARLAGGCTSGHGISGMSQLSLSSVITVMSMFGGGIGLAALLR